jgi:hypothetical protein
MPDRTTTTAFDTAAPHGERADALSQLQQEHMPGTTDLLPPENIRHIIDHALFQFGDGAQLHKAIDANVVPFPSRNLKLNQPGMKSVMLDDWQVNIHGDFWERPSGLSFDSLRMMVSQTPILNAVIMTRTRQMQRFCRIAESNNEAPGFEICHVERDHQLSKSERESINLLNRFMMNCGWEFKPRLRKSLRRDSFAQFIARSVRDSLTIRAMMKYSLSSSCRDRSLPLIPTKT